MKSLLALMLPNLQGLKCMRVAQNGGEEIRGKGDFGGARIYLYSYSVDSRDSTGAVPLIPPRSD